MNAPAVVDGTSTSQLRALALGKVENPLVIVELGRGIVDWNAAAQDLFGWSAGEALGKWPEALQHRGNAGLRMLTVEGVARSGKPYESRVIYVRKSGVEGSCVLKISPLTESAIVRGALLEYPAHGFLPAESPEAERILAREFIDSAPDPIFYKDRDGRHLACNESMRKIFRSITDAECIGRTVFEIPELQENAERYHADDMSVIQTGLAIVNREEPFEHSDGRRSWFLTSKYPRYDEHGNIVGLVGIARDITDMKRTAGELRVAQTRLLNHIDNSPLAVIEWDSDFRVLRWAGQAENIFGWRSEEIVGKHFNEWPFVHPADESRVSDAVGRLMDGSEQRNIVNNRNLTKEGRLVHCAWHNSVLPGEKGDRLYFLSLVRDVSDRVSAEEERRKAQAEKQAMERKLEEAQRLESLGILAGGIAHDFNNLLMGVLGNASLARVGLTTDSPAHELIDQIESAAVKASDLCKQMLAYSGKGRFAVGKIDANRMIRETSQLVSFSVGKNAELRLDLANGLPAISGDASQLSQVVMNLIINAAEAIGEKQGAITVSTGVTRASAEPLSSYHLQPEMQEGEFVVVEVSDNGMGMPPAVAARIFDPFFTTKISGRGLGLAAVLGIVRGHSGGMRLTSEAGVGTTFRLLFPVCDGVPEVSGREALDSARWRASGTVLIADDEEVVRSTVARMVEAIGFEAQLAENGRIGVEKFCENPDEYELVIVDLTMPQMSGEEACRLISEKRPGVRVLLMSGYDEQDARSRFGESGLSGFIQKPFNLASLEEKLRQVLSK